MCCTSGSQPGLKLVRLLVVSCLSLSGADFICQPCGAEPSLPIVPQPIAWASGPAKVSLRGIAELQVPTGYSYTDAKGAQAFLEGMRSGVPKELAGILLLRSTLEPQIKSIGTQDSLKCSAHHDGDGRFTVPTRGNTWLHAADRTENREPGRLLTGGLF